MPKNKDKRKSLSDFYQLYLKKRFDSKSLIIEWGVNILYYSHTYSSEAALLSLFTKIMNGSLDISSFYKLDAIIQKVKDVFAEADQKHNNGAYLGAVPKPYLVTYFKDSLWSKKSAYHIRELSDTLGDGIIGYEDIFGVESDFVDCICFQEFETAKTNLIALGGIIQTDQITCTQAREAIKSVYLQLSIQELKTILNNGFLKGNPKDSDKISKTDFIKNLSRFL